VSIHAETIPTDRKYLQLGKLLDRHGDPVAHVHYDSSDFDRRTHEFGRSIVDRIGKCTGATDWVYPGLDEFGTWAHHMGTCRMGHSVADGVVDSVGAVFDTPGLHVVGLSNFVGSGGAVNPTLTGVALALRAADRMIERARA
jgi:choline dehydrogenase-like flavoprotein